MSLLDPDNFKQHVDYFNSMEPEDVVNLIPDSQSWDWLKQNIPLFSCPDSELERIYLYRWWTYRKHIKQTPAGRIVTEFITPVRHAGSYNSISCALGFHIAEGRWLHDQLFLDEYIHFWFRGNEGKPEAKFHNYSSWAAAAIYERYLVTGDQAFLLDLLDELVADYVAWEQEKLLPSGIFWQFDVRDGMEESISGSRKHKNARPTINSYMYANALAIAATARLANRFDLIAPYDQKAAALKQLVQKILWDPAATFFKAQTEEGPLSSAREAIGFIPWCFNLPDQGYQDAWQQLIDPAGFDAPFGITTAERRHPQFRSHGVGKCEWDGAIWPFATSETLNALANVLRHYPQQHVTRQNYFHAFQTYMKSQHRDGRPYIGEYLDETTGEWLKGDNPRSRNYNHSTFCDLVITGLVGLVPRADETIEISPLLPADAWDWFCLDELPYHGRRLTILWDRHGNRYSRGAGLSLFVNGRRVGNRSDLGPLTAKL